MTMTATNALVGGNITLGVAGITGLSGAATTFSTANTINFLVKGAAYSKTAITGGATPTTDASTGSAFRPLVAQQPMAGYTMPNTGSACIFVFGLDSGGNTKVVQGPVVNYTDTSANSTALQFPQMPDTMTPFAYAVIKLVSATAATWTFGSNNWNATGITIDTPVNVGLLPANAITTA